MSTNKTTKPQRLARLLASCLVLALGATTVCAEVNTPDANTPIDVSAHDVQGKFNSNVVSKNYMRITEEEDAYALFIELQANSEPLYRAGIDTVTLKHMSGIHYMLSALLDEQKKTNYLLTTLVHSSR